MNRLIRLMNYYKPNRFKDMFKRLYKKEVLKNPSGDVKSRVLSIMDCKTKCQCPFKTDISNDN